MVRCCILLTMPERPSPWAGGHEGDRGVARPEAERAPVMRATVRISESFGDALNVALLV